jgi:magnesium transporter
MGGNAGTQTMTVAVRSLATRELGPLNALRFMRRELMVGVVNGILFALLIGAVGGVWFQDAMLGVVLGAAMIVNMVVAAVSGILVPMALDRMNIDPAVASSVFVTTMTDVVGFFAFLGLAAIWLM